jgi:hypothetical protein
MRTTRLPETDACPFCRKTLDAATASPDTPNAAPSEGDATFCLGCGSLLIFGSGLRLRRPTLQETSEVLGDPQAVSVLRAITDTLRRPVQ